MDYQTLDLVVIGIYFVVLLAVGFLSGRGKRATAGAYFFSKGMLPWWAIGCAYVAAGMNTEQLVGMNGMAYSIGLPLANWTYPVAVVVLLRFDLFLLSHVSAQRHPYLAGVSGPPF